MTEKDLDIAIEKCERIMEFDTRTLKNPESEDGWLFDKVYDLLQFLRQLQFGTDTNVGGNLIDRQAALDAIKKLEKPAPTAQHLSAIFDCEDTIKALPSAQPEPEEFEWCHTCREYDQEKHCCHRWTKVIRKTVDDMKAAQPGWIMASERLPEEEGLYLVAGDFPPGAEVHTRYFNVMYDRSVWSGTMTDKVKWWMPIPKPPEGAQDGV